VIATLPHNTEVIPLERRGDWILIQKSAGPAMPVEKGWVYGPSLKGD
jgi:hypothetical protein